MIHVAYCAYVDMGFISFEFFLRHQVAASTGLSCSVVGLDKLLRDAANTVLILGYRKSLSFPAEANALLELITGIEPVTSSLPRKCSTD